MRRAYLEDAQAWETGRNICAIAAGALYLYNIIDDFAAKGNNNIEGYSLKVRPSSTELGMAVLVKF